MNDALGDRMKMYEGGGDKLMPLLPAIARLDGKAFHTFTRGMTRPYDLRLSEMMVATTMHLVEEYNAKIGYTQSDEITLIWQSERGNEGVPFDGRVSKIVSIMAADCSTFFGSILPEAFPEKAGRRPLFDCRVWNVPNRAEAINVLIWRELDATRNSISMAAQSVFSHKELHGKHAGEMREMLFQKGINWNEYPDFFKRGTYVQRRRAEKPFSAAEIEKLPPRHEARTNPSLMVIRSEVRQIDMPPILKVGNREDVVFGGEEPVIVKNDTNPAPRLN